VAHQPWKPSAGQEREALNLSDAAGGGWARTRPDGLAELRTIKGGECHVYLIRKDGRSTLIERRPPTGAHDVVRALYCLAFGLFLASFFPWWNDSLRAWTIFGALFLFAGTGLISPFRAGGGAGWTWITRYPVDDGD
jgi:hypothetical protein